MAEFGEGLSEGFDWDLIRDLVDFDRVVRERFPSWAWALDHEELGPIIRKAAGDEEWSPDLFMSQIEASAWFTGRTEAQRAWDIFIESSPETDVNRRLAEAQGALSDIAATVGVELDEGSLNELALMGLRNQYSDDEMMGQILDRTTDTNVTVGSLQGLESYVREQAARFMIEIDDRTARDLATSVLRGEGDRTTIDEYVKTVARQRHPNEQIVQMIDAGSSLEQYFAPHRQLLGQMLGRTPDDIDLLRDPQFMSVLSSGDGASSRPMTLAETERHARSLDEYWTRPGGQGEQEIYNIAGALSTAMGVRR